MKQIKVVRFYEINSSVSGNQVKISIYSEGVEIDYCILDTYKEIIYNYFEDSTEELFDLDYTYGGYVKFFRGYGVNLNEERSKLLWKPQEQEQFYYVDYGDNTISFDYFTEGVHNILYHNYMIFPTSEMAKKSKNLSTLDRLQLLYQYTNNLLFEPNWKDTAQNKNYLSYNVFSDVVYASWMYENQQPIVYWEHTKDLTRFFELFRDEIINLMGCV